jgi:hypothetical protein
MTCKLNNLFVRVIPLYKPHKVHLMKFSDQFVPTSNNCHVYCIITFWSTVRWNTPKIRYAYSRNIFLLPKDTVWIIMDFCFLPWRLTSRQSDRYTSFHNKSKSRSCYGWRSVSQYVLVSSSLWNLWPYIIFCLKVAVLSLWGTLSEERSSLSPVSHCPQCLVHCQRFNIIYIVHVTCFKYMQYILDLCQHRLSTADHS